MAVWRIIQDISCALLVRRREIKRVAWSDVFQPELGAVSYAKRLCERPQQVTRRGAQSVSLPPVVQPSGRESPVALSKASPRSSSLRSLHSCSLLAFVRTAEDNVAPTEHTWCHRPRPGTAGGKSTLNAQLAIRCGPSASSKDRMSTRCGRHAVPAIASACVHAFAVPTVLGDTPCTATSSGKGIH